MEHAVIIVTANMASNTFLPMLCCIITILSYIPLQGTGKNRYPEDQSYNSPFASRSISSFIMSGYT